jgi:carbonic anhydrase
MGKRLNFSVALLLAASFFMGTVEAKISADEAIQKLLAGNQRYVREEVECISGTEERRLALFGKQQPFVAIVGCSDSRIAPEIIFDQGIGDLFVVRLAGNVVGSVALNSLEYAVKVLDVSLILVLGHANCGAVSAVLEGKASAIPAIAELIDPAIQESRNLPGNRLVNAIKANVEHTVQFVRNGSLFGDAIKNNGLKVVGGYYSLETGLVEILP